MKRYYSLFLTLSLCTGTVAPLAAMDDATQQLRVDSQRFVQKWQARRSAFSLYPLYRVEYLEQEALREYRAHLLCQHLKFLYECADAMMTHVYASNLSDEVDESVAFEVDVFKNRCIPWIYSMWQDKPDLVKKCFTQDQLHDMNLEYYESFGKMPDFPTLAELQAVIRCTLAASEPR